jgi:hypothetical protein
MICSRQSTTAIVALAVYLAGLMGGAFHHHSHWAPSRERQARPTIIDNANAIDSDGDDEHDCAVCASIHQTKTSPPVKTLVAPNTVAHELRISVLVHIPVVSSNTTHARAPPI